MPDLSGPFDVATWMQDRWYRDAHARAASGVFGTRFGDPALGDLPLTVAGLTISMGLGRAHVRGAGYERTGTAWSYDVPPNTDPNPRIDRLVLRRDLATGTVAPLVLQGAPAASPVAPALSQVEDGAWDLPLFRFTVPANSGAPLTGIVDERRPAGAPRNWGAVVGPLPVYEDGPRPGDTVYSETLKCRLMWTENPGGVAGGWWAQVGVATTESSVGGLQEYVDRLAAAGVTPPHNGFLLFDWALDRMWAARGGPLASQWWPMGGYPGGWQTSGITAASGWSVTNQQYSNLGNGLARVYCVAQRTGAALAVTVTGDITNSVIANLPAGWEAATYVPLSSGASGRMITGGINSGGTTLTISATTPGSNIATGESIELTGTYPLINPHAITV